MGLLDWFTTRITPEEIRVEIWKLGVRHHGEPLQGAEVELAEAGLQPGRTLLLQACVRALRSR